MSRWLIAGLLIALGTGSALAENKMCSGAGRDKTEMTFVEDGSVMLLNSAVVRERWEHAGSAGTGLNGSVYMNGLGESELLMHTTISMDSNEGHEDEPEIYLFRDRVFWPCDR